MSRYKKGDKITVSLTCEVSSVLDSGDLAVIHGDGRVGMVWKSALDSPTCTITRIEPPIKAGDRVRYMGEQWVVHGLSGQHAWLHSFAHESGCGYITQPICNLERIA